MELLNGSWEEDSFGVEADKVVDHTEQPEEVVGRPGHPGVADMLEHLGVVDMLGHLEVAGTLGC